jgi:hypothetical protein
MISWDKDILAYDSAHVLSLMIYLHIIVSSPMLMYLIYYVAVRNKDGLSLSVAGRAEGGQEFANYKIDKNEITLGNLITMKSSLGYGASDYLYYKRRNGTAAATLRACLGNGGFKWMGED